MSRAKQSRAYFQPQTKDAAKKPCEWPGCSDAGEFRAPKSRDNIGEYRWFCLDHIREVNKTWNYFEGMNEDEIEFDRRRDTVWQRPSWKWGTHAGAFERAKVLDEDLAGFVGMESGANGAGQAENKRKPVADTPHARALAILNLDFPVTPDDIKARYKELVKRYHPDATGGDKEAEEKFKLISDAYRTLMTVLAS